MKHFIATTILLISAQFCLSQAYPNYINNNEFKFNIGNFLATSSIGFGYEHYLNEDTSIGGTLYFNSDETKYNGSFGIGPNLRAYFGFQPRGGIFAEAFGIYYTGEETNDTNLDSRNLKYNTTALGLGGGYKWTTPSQRFILELSGGVGRNINPENFQNTFMFRGALSIGFRF